MYVFLCLFCVANEREGSNIRTSCAQVLRASALAAKGRDRAQDTKPQDPTSSIWMSGTGLLLR